MSGFASSNNQGKVVHTYSGPIPARPKPAPTRLASSICYVMDGGGVPLRGSTASNGGRVRLRERDRLNDENLRTHDRLSKVQSSIPKARKSKKPTGPATGNGEIRKRSERSKIVAGNRKIEKALKDIYKSDARLKGHGVKKKDCTKMWKGRTALYDSTSDNVANKSTVKRNTGVPSAAGAVACGGCGGMSYCGADGNAVFPGAKANMDGGHRVFYCNEVCAAIDWELNHENTNVQTKGFRPLRKANYWVQSRAAVEARKMLRKAVDAGREPDYDAIMAEIKVQRGLGAAQNAAIALTLPGAGDDEDKGLTGAQRAKKHIIKGAEHMETWVDGYVEPDIWHGAAAPTGTFRQQVEREKRDRYMADKAEIARIVRVGTAIPKGSVDKNAQTKPASPKQPSADKWKNSSKVVLTAPPDNGKEWDKEEMYKTSAALQRHADESAAKQAAKAAAMANRGKARAQSKKEFDSYNDKEKKERGGGGNRFNIKRVSHLPKKEGKVAFVEKPRSIGGLKYDAAKGTRNEDYERAEPKQAVVDKDEDPALFRQSMDMIKLSR